VSSMEVWRGHPRNRVTSGSLAYLSKTTGASAEVGRRRTSRAV
jgi:hypothetical protein